MGPGAPTASITPPHAEVQSSALACMHAPAGSTGPDVHPNATCEGYRSDTAPPPPPAAPAPGAALAPDPGLPAPPAPIPTPAVAAPRPPGRRKGEAEVRAGGGAPPPLPDSPPGRADPVRDPPGEGPSPGRLPAEPRAGLPYDGAGGPPLCGRECGRQSRAEQSRARQCKQCRC